MQDLSSVADPGPERSAVHLGAAPSSWMSKLLSPRHGPSLHSSRSLRCINYSCESNFAHTSANSVKACICQGVEASCRDFPTSKLCAGMQQQEPLDCPGSSGLWAWARQHLDREVCTL